MFLPFLPYIFALAGASLLLFQPGPTPTALGLPLSVQVALSLLVPLLAGWVVGLLPAAWVGPRLALRPTRRRWLTLFLWLGVGGLTPLVPELQQVFTAVFTRWAEALGWPGLAQATEEATLAVLLADYWLADTLTLHPPHFRDAAPRPATSPLSATLVREPGFWRVLMLPVPFLALVGLGMIGAAALEGGIEGLLANLLAPRMGAALDALRPLIALALSTGFTLVALLILMPVLIRWCWGLKPLLLGEADAAIRGELAANGVKVAAVLGWPEQMTGVVTAGVIGVLPGFRYLLFGNILAAALSPAELRSVTAHEAAHLRFRHPMYYVFAVLACILLVQALSQGVQLAGMLLADPVPAWIVLLGELAGLLFALRFGFGTLSRHFERQADGHAYERQGLDAFQSALSKVAKLNGIPTELNNWHHHGISHRIGYLAQVQANPARLGEHARSVKRQKVLWVALLILGVSLQAATSASPLVAQAAQGYWERRVAEAEAGKRPLARTDLPGLNALASLAYERQDLARAEKYFRLILSVAPEDPQTQNNLAWLLVTRPAPDAAAVQEGLALAKRAAQAREMAFIWDTLAEAYSRTGQAGNAHAAAAKALELARQGRGLGETGLDYYRQRVRAFPGDGTRPSLPKELPRPDAPPRSPEPHPRSGRPLRLRDPGPGVRMVRHAREIPMAWAVPHDAAVGRSEAACDPAVRVTTLHA